MHCVRIIQVLDKMNLSLSDIDVFEIHEAFAGQVLANLTAMGSAKFAEEQFADKKMIGAIDMEKINRNGGSLSLGHPFGATGVRLVTTAANRLIAEDKRYALLTACADSGLAHACILERYDGPWGGRLADWSIDIFIWISIDVFIHVRY